MSSDLHEITHRLPHLSAFELDQLHERIKALKHMGGNGNSNEATKVAGDLDIVLDVIVRVMRRNGHDYSNAKMLQRSRNYNAFTQKVPALMEYLKAATGNRLEQCGILEISVRLLCHEIKHWEVPITDQLVMVNIDRIPAVINKHFPGYAKHGMLKMLVKR